MNCDCLIHPFQNDPGTSQAQRAMDDLLSGAAKIDARTLADLLSYFVQMSRHINFYDTDLNTYDWQPFFRNSVPFTLASIIKFPLKNTEDNFDLYKTIFEQKPSSSGLQLVSFSLYYRFINSINNWHLLLKDSGLPVAESFEDLIKKKLQAPVLQFIQYSNTAVKNYGIRAIDFRKLSQNPVWGLDQGSITKTDNTFPLPGTSKEEALRQIYSNFNTFLTVFSDVFRTMALEAENNLERSFIPLKEELQKKHPPHLALLFVFLNMFRQLQNSLNEYTRKHLDYFYREILQFKPVEAVADKANIVFEIQTILKNYLVRKGIRVKDGKDNNKQDILFSLDDDIVVNQAKLADKRTLFLNNKNINAQTYVEGVYMAPVAGMADGLEKDFPEGPHNFSTLGSKFSKYIDPETGVLHPYPNARIGFILASNVLFMQKGSTRHIDINLPCFLNDPFCPDLKKTDKTSAEINDFLINIYNDLNNIVNNIYYNITESLIKEALKKGISKELADSLRESFLTEEETEYEKKNPCCREKKRKTETTVTETAFVKATAAYSDDEKQILKEIIRSRRAFSFYFSGEDEWIEPSTIDDLELIPGNLPNNLRFTLHVRLTLKPEKGAVTSYNKENLKEDFRTTMPLLKILLDDKIKINGIVPGKNDKREDEECCTQDPNCCLLRSEKGGPVSLYHFFRNVTIDKIDNKNKKAPVIRVEVCGMKNFIVQNDESVMDVNSPVYPFGARPDIINFDMENPPAANDPPLIGPAFYIGSEEVFFKKWKHVRINIKWKDKPDDFNAYYGAYIKNGLNDADFKLKASVLLNGKWKQVGDIKSLFANSKFWTAPPATIPSVPTCEQGFVPDQKYLVFSNNIGVNSFITDQKLNKKLEVNTLNGFLRLNLVNQDFLHKNYSFVLARQMMALGRLPKELLTNAVYKDNSTNTVFVFSDVFGIMDNLKTHVQETKTSADTTETKTQQNIVNADVGNQNPAHPEALDTKNKAKNANDDIDALYAVNSLFPFFQNAFKDKLEALIPNEPWTPVISNISLDYSAESTLEDIDLIHLYPYEGTYKKEEPLLQPALFPSYCDEGTLFMGFSSLVPGNNLNLLFQMADATSDSESEKETVNWHYLDSNTWKTLRPGFELLDDGTNNLTGTGIIKLLLPANMTLENTVMPAGLHWIKASIPKNSAAVAETTGIHPHAIRAVFTNAEENDKLRLAKTLPAGSIARLEVADASVRSVNQPYETFGGSVPEIEQEFYIRVSETLRHKGRAIQAFDYERLVLQAFPRIFKVKCINHSFALNAHEYKNDFPYAGGYVTLVVIPDLNKLKAGNSFEPKAPVSLLEEINEFVRKRTSPFVRFRAMNPRYETVDFCIHVRLQKGKDENYYRQEVKDDIRTFLAPWAVGDYYKLTFGQCVYRSDIIQYLETRDYVEFIGKLLMGKQGHTDNIPKVCPDTPRSILIAGDVNVCIIPDSCEEWDMEYTACDKRVRCDTKPEIISDYCRKKIVK